MSRYFVDASPVAVPEFDPAAVLSDTPPNVIYIKPKMDLATDAKVKNELVTMGADNKTMEMRLGENQLALLIHNIVRWDGPDLSAIPCTPATIRTLDPTEPHIVLVLDEIARRNARAQAPIPNERTEPISAISGLRDVSQVSAPASSHPSVNGILKPASRSALTGHLRKSEP